MQVVELRPEPQVTVIDTDMEIDLDLPEKAREQLEEKSAQDRARTMRAHMGAATAAASSAVSSPGQSLSPPPRAASAGAGGHVLGGAGATGPGMGGAEVVKSSLSPMDDSEDDYSDVDSDDERSKRQNAFDPAKHRLAKLQELPEEPPRDEVGVFTCQLRSPQGRFTRRFRFEDTVGVLLDFAEAQGGVPGQYRLVVPFPRRILTRDDSSTSTTLREAGLTSKQESVILERL